MIGLKVLSPLHHRLPQQNYFVNGELSLVLQEPSNVACGLILWVQTYIQISTFSLSQDQGSARPKLQTAFAFLWTGIKGLHVASSNLSRASFADQLNEARVILPGVEYNAFASQYQ